MKKIINAIFSAFKWMFSYLPYTTWFIVIYNLVYLLPTYMGARYTFYTSPWIRFESSEITFNFIIEIISVIIFGFELIKSSRYRPESNNIDMISSFVIAAIFFASFYFEDYKSSVWAFMVMLTWIDAIFGIIFIANAARRNFEN